MTKARKTRRIAVKRMVDHERTKQLKKSEKENDENQRLFSEKGILDREALLFHLEQAKSIPQISSGMFLTYNNSLGPPFHILLDTNFINFSMQNKMEIIPSLMDCLMAKCIPYLCDCVLAELEKLGKKFRIALRLARDPRFSRLTCDSTYADDCIMRRVTQHRFYIVATCDKDLKRRIRKIPGVPIMYISRHRYTIERLPEVFGAPDS